VSATDERDERVVERAARERAPELQRRLCAWFERVQRPLPWRRTRDPYAVWISEAMLQQTRAEVVGPYWERFLARFPDAGSLARADEQEVIAHWSGLGYYRRARSLHAAARAIVHEHGGALPRTRADWLALPGVGEYTAGAVLSIALDQPEALVDGNVARVYARLEAIDAPLESAATRARLWQLARELVPRHTRGAVSPRNWNQGLMELGATVCTPRQPRCAECPLQADCRAFATGRVHELPRASAKLGPIAVELEALFVLEHGRVLLHQRAAGGRMAELWELPTRELAPEGATTRLFPRELPELARGRFEAGEELGELRHAITRHRIRLHVRKARILGASKAAARAAPSAPGARLAWYSAAHLQGLALTGMARKLLRLRGIALLA
jgi:A/G-specific adenine glycosylase